MAFPHVLPSSRVPDPAVAPPLNWGILAPGGIARQFASAARLSTRQRIVAVGSRSIDNARAFAADFGVTSAYGSYEALVADPTVEAVYVASPHSDREARKLVDAARRRGVALMEAMWTRFLPHTDVVRQLLADGTIGELEVFAADHGQQIPPERAWRLHDPKLAGGALLDLGVYPVSFASFVLGRPDAVLASGSLTETGVDRQVSVLLTRFADHPHAQALVSCTLAAKTPTTATISGSLARIELDGDFYAPNRVRLVSPSGETVTSAAPPVLGHQGLAYEAAHFAQLVADGFTESPQLPLDETIAIMEVLDEIRSQVRVRYPGE